MGKDLERCYEVIKAAKSVKNKLFCLRPSIISLGKGHLFTRSINGKERGYATTRDWI